MRTHYRTCLLILLVLVSAVSAHAQYTVKDLGTLGGSESWAYDINDYGQVVGGAADATGTIVPFVWTQSAGMKSLGKMPNAQASGGYAAAINKIGQIAGWAVNKDGIVHPFRWSQAVGMVDLGNAYKAWGINDLGNVVGETYIANNRWTGFFWTPDKGMKPIGMVMSGYGSAGYDVNSQNLSVGYSRDLYGRVSPVAWIGSVTIKFLLTLPNQGGVAYAVNNKNEIVGTSGTRAVFWDRYFFIKDIGTLKSGGSSRAYDINDLSHAVGCCYVPGTIERRYAFIWTAQAGMKELTVPAGFRDAEAWAINNLGQIVGVAVDQSGKRRAIMWQKSTGTTDTGSGDSGKILPPPRTPIR